MTLRRVCPLLLAAGLAFMLPFEAWYTRLLGMTCLVAFVVTGVFLIASPEYLARDDEDEPTA